MIFGRPPCERSTAARDEALAVLIEGQDSALSAHVEACLTCAAALSALRRDREAFRSLGDVPGAAPNDGELRGLLMAVRTDQERRPFLWLGWALAAATLVVGALGLRHALVLRNAARTDAALVADADAAYRRAEREYAEATALLKEELRRLEGDHPDPRVAEGARALAEARVKAADLVRERRGDAEREALLREALRAEVRYYEDAILRRGAPPEGR